MEDDLDFQHIFCRNKVINLCEISIFILVLVVVKVHDDINYPPDRIVGIVCGHLTFCCLYVRCQFSEEPVRQLKGYAAHSATRSAGCLNFGHVDRLHLAQNPRARQIPL